MTTPVFTESGDVVIDVPDGVLSGTYLLPASANATVLIIGGSGPTDRNGNTHDRRGSDNLKLLAEALEQTGIASLRFDKRLIDDSVFPSFSESDLRFETYVDDAVLWYTHLAKHTTGPIYIIGHSEGALIGQLVATRVSPTGLVFIAGVGRPAHQLLLEQVEKQLSADLLQQTRIILAELAAGRAVESPPTELYSLFRHSVQPYLMSWFQYDPSDIMQQLTMPILLVYGSMDMQVGAAEGEQLLASNKTATLKTITGMNHVFKRVESDDVKQLNAYSDPSLPIMDELVNEIVAFIREHST